VIPNAQRQVEDLEKKLRVLVVEDEPRLRDLLLHAIPDMGFEALGARTAEEGLRFMEADPRGLIILDLNLPGMSGMEFFEVVRQKWPQTQVVVLTGFGDLSAAKQAIHLDVVDFLTKPCHLGDLERALDRARRRLAPPDAAPVLPPLGPEDAADEDVPADQAALTAEGAAAQVRKLDDIEREHILAALERNVGNRTATATELGISLRTLYYRLDEYRKKGWLKE
jgi:DNA-binding NtrC family response regulator